MNAAGPALDLLILGYVLEAIVIPTLAWRVARTRRYHRHVAAGLTVNGIADAARAILDGSLIAADAKTAKLVGLSEKETLEVEKALEAEKAKALEELQARYGKSATLDKVPVEAEGDDEQKEPAAPAAKKLTANLRIEEGK
jgi:hypothetical protein